MSKRTVSGITIILLLISVLTLTVDIQPVEASGTIYIRADGSVEGTTHISSVDNVTYTFTDNIYNKSIVIEINNITLDGNGHLLWGLNNYPHMGIGIWVRWRRNVTITDIVISNNYASSIFLDESSNCRIVNNSILGIDCWWGIRLSYSSYNLLANNTIMNTYRAIELAGSNHNTLSNNEITDNTQAIWLWPQGLEPSMGNTLRNNVMTSNKYSFLVTSHFMSPAGYMNDVDTSNIIDGKPIYYWINRCNETVPLDAGCVVIVDSSGITVKNLRLRNTGIGVCLAYTENSIIENVTATTNFIGIILKRSDSNVVTKNNLTGNDGPGIFLGWSGRNNLTENFVQNSNSSGIWLEDCLPGYNTIAGNTVSYSRWTKPQEWDGAGILVDDSSHCKVIDNNVTSNSFGITVAATPATANQLSGNNIVMNDVGLMLGGAVQNAIYRNNFVDNKLQVGIGEGIWEPRYNTFDGGYLSGGNYWSDYNGTDVYSGPYQNETGSDGIGDTPYVIDEERRDRYPLMRPWGDVESPVAEPGSNQSVFQGMTVTFDASRSTDDIAIKSYVWAFTDVTPKTLKGIQPQYTFKNAGDFEVTLNVTDYAGKWDTDTLWIHVLTDATKPSIETVSQEPQVPDEWEKVTITVNVTDGESGVHNVTFSYSTNEGATWTNVPMNRTTGDTYVGEIPELPAGTNVQYNITAYDKAGNFEVDPQLGQYYVYTIIPEFPAFMILPLLMILLIVAILGKRYIKHKT